MSRESLWERRARQWRERLDGKPQRAPPKRKPKAEPPPKSVDEGEARLNLPESLDLAAAPELLDNLRARRGKPTVVDASAVARVGAPCLQVLVSAVRTWAFDGVALSFVGWPPSIAETLELVGLGRELRVERSAQ